MRVRHGSLKTSQRVQCKVYRAEDPTLTVFQASVFQAGMMIEGVCKGLTYERADSVHADYTDACLLHGLFVRTLSLCPLST